MNDEFVKDNINYTSNLAFNLSDDDISYSVAGVGSAGNLSNLNIPPEYKNKPVTAIGFEAFKNCPAVHVIIPDSVTNIEYNAFCNCEKLTDVKIGNGVKSVAFNAFALCRSLTSITIPESVRNLGFDAFRECSSLETAKIGNGVEDIQSETFKNCSILNTVYIGDGVRNISTEAFYCCSKLTNLTLGKNVNYIGSKAFYGCTSLRELTLPDSLTEISDNAFYGCLALETLVLGAKVEFVLDNSFEKCDAIKRIIIPDEIVEVDCWNFENFPSLQYNEYEGGKYLGNDKNPYLVLVKASGSTVNIHNDVKLIHNNAFIGNQTIKSVNIPKSIKNISCGMFSDCNSLKDIYYQGDIASWCAITGLGNLVTTERNVYINGKKLSGELVIPDGLTSIGNATFCGCDGITSVVLPESVNKIDDSAFYGCSNLTDITWTDRLKIIGNFAFYGCDGLKSVVIPDGVEGIGVQAFKGCNSLTEITIPTSMKAILGEAFCGCVSLTTIKYGGTKAQWKAVDKVKYWDAYTGKYTLECKDGIIKPLKNIFKR